MTDPSDERRDDGRDTDEATPAMPPEETTEPTDAPNSEATSTGTGSGTGDATDASGSDADADGGRVARVRRAVDYAVLGVLLLVGLVAVFQFYTSTQSAITTWVTPEYRSVFRALFNLAVLLAVGGGVAYQLRRMEFGGRRTD